MLVTITYQYKDGNGTLTGKKDVAIKGSGNAVDKATKVALNDFFAKNNIGDIYLLTASVR